MSCISVITSFFSCPSVSVPGINNTESQYYIVVSAAETATAVTVTLPSETSATTGTTARTGSTPFSVTLTDGNQILTLTSSDDLTGTVITADKKIGVIAGTQMMKSHENCTTSAHTAEQMTPTETWGMKHVFRALANGMVNFVRIIGEFSTFQLCVAFNGLVIFVFCSHHLGVIRVFIK